MQELSNLEVYFLVRELNVELSGTRLANFYDGALFRFKFNNGENLLVDFTRGAFLSNKFPLAETPSSFAMLFRKHLDNARFLCARQLNDDRILVLEFEKREKFFVIIELFREGNLILCDSSMKIIAVLHSVDYASRKLRRHHAYLSPPSSKKSVSSLTASDLLSLNGSLVSALSKAVNLSPFYLEEACFRSGLSFDKKSLTELEAVSLLSAIKSLFQSFQPAVYESGGVPVVFSVTLLKKVSGLSLVEKTFPTLSQALEHFFGLQPAKIEKKDSKKDFIRLQQSNALKEFEEKGVEATKKAEWIYANYSLITMLLEKACDKASVEELNALAAGICRVERKGKELVLEVA